MDTPGYTKKTVDVGNRSFQVQLIRFENGNFVSISEGSQKLGSMVVSIGTGPTPTTTTIIPAKTGSLFLKLTAEKISTYAKGISIVSMFATNELGNDVAKALMTNIMEMVRAE
jgi:hypothetical protein